MLSHLLNKYCDKHHGSVFTKISRNKSFRRLYVLQLKLETRNEWQSPEVAARPCQP